MHRVIQLCKLDVNLHICYTFHYLLVTMVSGQNGVDLLEMCHSYVWFHCFILSTQLLPSMEDEGHSMLCIVSSYVNSPVNIRPSLSVSVSVSFSLCQPTCLCPVCLYCDLSPGCVYVSAPFDKTLINTMHVSQTIVVYASTHTNTNHPPMLQKSHFRQTRNSLKF